MALKMESDGLRKSCKERSDKFVRKKRKKKEIGVSYKKKSQQKLTLNFERKVDKLITLMRTRRKDFAKVIQKVRFGLEILQFYLFGCFLLPLYVPSGKLSVLNRHWVKQTNGALADESVLTGFDGHFLGRRNSLSLMTLTDKCTRKLAG